MRNRNRRALVAYFTLAYAFSWGIGIPLALSNHGLIDPVLPVWSHYLIGYGPALSAFIVAATVQGRPALRDLTSRIVRWDVGFFWWAVALAPVLISVVSARLIEVFGGTSIGLSDFGNVHFLPPLGPAALLLWMLTFGIGEEIGWRGFALPRLQKERSAFSATVVLVMLWALWHLPQFFYVFEPSIAVGWLAGLAAGGITFTWLFNSTRGSVLIVAVAHGAFNFGTASITATDSVAAVTSSVVMIWAVIVILVFKPRDLSRWPKSEFPARRDPSD